MEIQKIKVDNTYRLFEIIYELERGKLKVPRFQREFVWERSKIINLLDSIYKEFPIGSFFLWRANKKYASFFRDIQELDLPKPDRTDEINFILDGQQRITSLYVALKGKRIGGTDYGRISFDLDSGKFVLRNSRRFSGKNVVPVHKLFGDDHLEIYDALSLKQKEKFTRCHQIFQNYPLSVIVVRDMELQDAIKIFERINQGGKRLSIFDLVVASTWGDDFDLRVKYEVLEKFFINNGFGRINPEIVLHATALIIKGYCRQQHLLQLKREEIKENWSEIEDSIKLAVEYMQNNLGAKIFGFVPYPAMISLLAYLFFNIKGRAINSKMNNFVHQWFWQAALGERYSSSRDTAMEEDRKKIFDIMLSGKEPNIKYPITDLDEKIKSLRISTKSAIRNAIYCLLAQKKPRHFKNNTAIELSNRICSEYNSREKHHIFPRDFLKKQKMKGINLVLNFCFIPAELNKEILNSKPSKYFENYRTQNDEFEDALESHLIPDGDFININDYEAFINERAKLILEEFSYLTGTKINKMIGQDKNKAIDKIELGIRDLIDDVLLKNCNEQYWSTNVPEDIRANVNKKIKANLRKNPHIDERSISNKERLTNCDIMDYQKIINSNWKLFGDLFRSKGSIETKFVNYKDYRNAVKHNKELDTILRKEGEAAIEWLSKVIDGWRDN